MQWFQLHCDGDWEHQFGIKIETLDNPGWNLQVSIQETELQNIDFQVVDIERGENDWVFCNVKNGFFEGYCGPSNLEEMFEIFRSWAEKGE